MSWESGRPNMILTLENIDEIEEIYKSASKIFPGCHQDHYYYINSYDPRHFYGMCRAKSIFKALKKLMKEQSYTGDKNREYLNHWRWIPNFACYANESEPRSEGGSLIHYYTSRYPNDEDPEEREFTTLDGMNASTQDFWREINLNVIKPPFYRGGNPYRKLGIGVNFDNIWWCKSHRQVGFSSYTKDRLILEI